MLPLQGDLPYDDANDEEQDHQREQPGAEALLLPCGGQRREGAVALRRLPLPKSIFFLREHMPCQTVPHQKPSQLYSLEGAFTPTFRPQDVV